MVQEEATRWITPMFSPLGFPTTATHPSNPLIPASWEHVLGCHHRPYHGEVLTSHGI